MSDDTLINITDVNKQLEKIKTNLDSKELGLKDILIKLSNVTNLLAGPWVHINITPEDFTSKMKKLGELDGREIPPIPASDATEESRPTNENSAIERCDHWYRHFKEAVKKCNENLQDILYKLNFEIEKFKKNEDYYGEEIGKAQVDIETNATSRELKNALGDLSNKHKEFGDAKNNMEDFNTGHDLDMKPKYDTLIVFWSIAFLCALIETGANGLFYAQASETGLIGGWITAFFITVTIMSLSFLSGFAIREKNKRSKVTVESKSEVEKTIMHWEECSWGHTLFFAWIVPFVCIASALSFIFIAAIYRDEASLQAGRILIDDQFGRAVLQEVYTRILAGDLLPKADIDGFILIIINIIIAAISGLKGYFSFTSVPDYKKYAEALKKARKNYKEAVEKAVKESSEKGELEATKRIHIPSKEELKEIFDHYKKVTITVCNLESGVDGEVESINKECNGYLRAYREANIARRADHNPAPKYFEEYTDNFEIFELNTKEFEIIDIDKISIRELQKELHQQGIKAIGDIKKLYEKVSDRINSHAKESEK